MSDKEISPTSFLPQGRIAALFYEMHLLCEHQLDFDLRQKNLISLGYLLYASEDAILLLQQIQWACPRLIKEVHQLMLEVCHEALLIQAREAEPDGYPKLVLYNKVARSIQGQYRLLKARLS